MEINEFTINLEMSTMHRIATQENQQGEKITYHQSIESNQ